MHLWDGFANALKGKEIAMVRLFVMFSVLVFAGLALTGCKAEVERTDQTSVAAPQ